MKQKSAEKIKFKSCLRYKCERRNRIRLRLFCYAELQRGAERTRAIQQVTRSLINAYWEIGRQIVESQEQHGWGKSVVEQLSKDLQRDFPGQSVFSARNLWEMRRFYETYKDFQNLQQAVAEIPWGHHRLIMQKCQSPEERAYYIKASAAMGWSRNVMLNQVKANGIGLWIHLRRQSVFNLPGG